MSASSNSSETARKPARSYSERAGVRALHHTREAPPAMAYSRRASRTAVPAPLPRAAATVAMPRTRQAPGSPSGATNPTATSAPPSKTPTANASEGSCAARLSTVSCRRSAHGAAAGFRQPRSRGRPRLTPLPLLSPRHGTRAKRQTDSQAARSSRRDSSQASYSRPWPPGSNEKAALRLVHGPAGSIRSVCGQAGTDDHARELTDDEKLHLLPPQMRST
jgi:hypothetical protein